MSAPPAAPVRATPPRSPLPPAGPPRVEQPAAAGLPWLTAVASGVAVLLAGVPVSAIVLTSSWFGYAALAAVVVVAVGLVLHRLGATVTAVGQCVAVVLLLTARFADHGILGVLPGPAALGEFGELIRGAGQQISVGIAPVQPTPEIMFLVTGAFGMLTVAVYLAAVIAGAPAAAGVPLLAIFAVPAALADDLLPWWALVAAGAGFGLLLVVRDGARRQVSGGVAVVAGAVVVALLVGAGAGFIGTSGRFAGNGAGAGSAGSIGLSPFTALRGQLQQSTPVELFRVRGLPEPAYLRALTLRDYLPDFGWQTSRPDPGVPLPGPTGNPNTGAGKVANIQIENTSFRDFWLPVYGQPLTVSGLPTGQWFFDERSGTGYTMRVRQDGSWQESSLLPAPTAADLRADNGAGDPGADYLNTQGVDQRVIDMAQQAVAGTATRFDKAMALQNFFTGPSSGFTYSLQTKPGDGDDALVEFLTTGRSGYCEQFASAMAVMLRTVGVPARVAVGFTGGKADGDVRSVSTSDAHAWVEAWFPQHGWITFDPTPLNDGRTITPPYVQEARGDNAAGSTPQDDPKIPRNSPNDAATPPSAPPVAPTEPTAAPTSDTGSSLPLWPIGVLVLVAAAALVPFALRSRERRRRLAAVTAGGPGAAAAAWDELQAESTDRGSPSRPSETVRATARRLVSEHRLEAPAQAALRDVVGAVEASWYGDSHPAPGALDEPVRAVQEGIAAGTALSLRERLLPRSVVGTLLGRIPGRKRAAEPQDSTTG
ncbi:transglutaminase TgpA family protein [Pseudonocardia sp. GCM10023141]|uniref:transglutaminase TgpA family protein n=1 Tax=Pseudonocardia sp. GCM10023141 TaxID=3252653 RepID=UPI003605FDC0